MAKIYDEKEIEDLERQATLKQRQDAAMKILESQKPDPGRQLVASMNERSDWLRGLDKARTDRWHETLDKAREDRLDRMRRIAEKDPGRYAPGVFAPTLSKGARAALDYLERQENRPEYSRRFDVTNETERIKAEQEAAGKIGYGRDAAAIKSSANKEIAQTEWGTKERIAQGEIAAKKWLGVTESKDRRYGIDAEHGKIGEDGKVTPGSRERTATIQGQDQIKIEQERGKSALAQTEIQNLNAQLDRESRERIAQITASGRFNAAKVIAASRDIAALTKDVLDPTEKAMIIAKYKEDNKDNPDAIAAADAIGGGQQQQQQKPKEGDRMKFDDGWATFVPGKGWVKDAQ